MIRIYTIEDCTYCTKLKELLDESEIKYVNVDINLPENKIEFDKINEIAKCDSVPIVKVGKQILAPDISFKSIDEAVRLTKRFLNG